MLVVGILLTYLEANRPGMVVPGASGLLLVLLAVFGFAHLPLSGFGLLGVAIGFGSILLTTKHRVFGLLTVLVLARSFHALTEPRPGLLMAIVAAFLLSISSMELLRLAVLARRNKFTLGLAGTVGKAARALTLLNPAGRIDVGGELHDAMLLNEESVSAGTALVVREVCGHELRVSSVQPKAPPASENERPPR